MVRVVEKERKRKEKRKKIGMGFLPPIFRERGEREWGALDCGR